MYSGFTDGAQQALLNAGGLKYIVRLISSEFGSSVRGRSIDYTDTNLQMAAADLLYQSWSSAQVCLNSIFR